MTFAQKRSRRISATSVAIFLNVAVLAVLSALMAAGVERTLTSRSISSRLVNLSDNLAQLVQIREQNMAQMTSDLDQAQSELASAQEGIPTLGAPYELFRRGFAMGSESDVVVESIQLSDTQALSTPMGDMQQTTYRIALSGSIPNCVAYLRQLESEGKPFLATEQVLMQENDLTCSFDVSLLGTDGAGLPANP
jgi:hypothetical protein